MSRYAILIGAVLMAATAHARPPVDLSTLDAGMPGPRTQVLVLGSVHLSRAPKTFRPESLQPLLDRLAAFKPDIITVEQLPGEACDLMAHYPTLYAPDDIKPYCADTSAAKKATGLDVPAAVAEVVRTLKAWPAKPSAAQRRHLAAVFLAANDAGSALVQWWQLPEAERHAGDGLDDALVAQLAKRSQSNNETNQIAARLAVRLGLQRLHPVDDHTGDAIDIPDSAAYGKAVQAAWDRAKPERDPVTTREDVLLKSGDMLALYRFINDPASLRTVAVGDFGAALHDPSPQHYGRLYVAGWEARNLHMVANVRFAFATRPGAHVLSIVGSEHKPWFDALLG